jgi:uncharacterized Fe-S radical SAM superfamily protein PflX
MKALSVDEWEAKVQRYAKYQHVNIKSNPKNASNKAAQMEAESSKLLAMLAARDFVVAIDERGDACTSFDFANLLATAGTTLMGHMRGCQRCATLCDIMRAADGSCGGDGCRVQPRSESRCCVVHGW